MNFSAEAHIIRKTAIFPQIKTLAERNKIGVAGICHRLSHILYAVSVHIVTAKRQSADCMTSSAAAHKIRHTLVNNLAGCDKLKNRADTERIKTAVYHRAVLIFKIG